MFDGIRATMRVPLARPPGRRSVWSRFAPELCALAVYGFGLAVLLYRSCDAAYYLVFDPDGQDVMSAVVAAYCLAALVLMVLPLVQALSAWHGEHARGTADALVLTPSDHAALARGRYWHIAWPWLRFMLWMAPLYAALACHRFAHEAADGGSEALLVGGLGVGASKGLFGFLLVDLSIRTHDLSAVGLLLVLGRWLCDVKSLLVLVAIGSCVAARLRSSAGLLAAYILLPLAVATACSFHDWTLGLLALIDNVPTVTISARMAGGVYVAVSVLVIAAEIFLAVWAYRSLARNFDACMTGEKPDRIGAHRRRPA